jgi:hypothetical protein
LNKPGSLVLGIGVATVLMGIVRPARTETISFIGNLQTDASFLPPGNPPLTDADYAQWAAAVQSFHVSSTSTMEAITFSYGGGTNGHGAVIAEGGFEPYLSLFDASGHFLASTLFGTTCPPGANTNTNSGSCFDVQLNGGTLAAGGYQIAISAFENLSLAENLGTGNLSDGFTGLGNLAQGEDLHYAFDVILSPTAAVPEPSFPFLIGVGIAICLFRRKPKGANSMKNKLLTLAGALALLALLGHFYAKPLLAQVRAVLVENLDEPGRNPYQEVRSDLTCGFRQSCTQSFSAVPAGKRLVLTNISGYIEVDGGTIPYGTLQSSLSGSQYASVVFTTVGGASIFGTVGQRFVFNQNIRAYFGPGEIPTATEVLITVTDEFVGPFSMMVSGYYVNLP